MTRNTLTNGLFALLFTGLAIAQITPEQSIVVEQGSLPTLTDQATGKVNDLAVTSKGDSPILDMSKGDSPILDMSKGDSPILDMSKGDSPILDMSKGDSPILDKDQTLSAELF